MQVEPIVDAKFWATSTDELHQMVEFCHSAPQLAESVNLDGFAADVNRAAEAGPAVSVSVHELAHRSLALWYSLHADTEVTTDFELPESDVFTIRPAPYIAALRKTLPVVLYVTGWRVEVARPNQPQLLGRTEQNNVDRGSHALVCSCCRRRVVVCRADQAPLSVSNSVPKSAQQRSVFGPNGVAKHFARPSSGVSAGIQLQSPEPCGQASLGPSFGTPSPTATPQRSPGQMPFSWLTATQVKWGTAHAGKQWARDVQPTRRTVAVEPALSPSSPAGASTAHAVTSVSSAPPAKVSSSVRLRRAAAAAFAACETATMSGSTREMKGADMGDTVRNLNGRLEEASDDSASRAKRQKRSEASLALHPLHAHRWFCSWRAPVNQSAVVPVQLRLNALEARRSSDDTSSSDRRSDASQFLLKTTIDAVQRVESAAWQADEIDQLGARYHSEAGKHVQPGTPEPVSVVNAQLVPGWQRFLVDLDNARAVELVLPQ